MISGISGTGGISTALQIRQALFNRLDANGDGVIDKAEIEAALQSGKKTAAGGNNSVFAAQVLGKLDTNNDGVITQSEFDAAFTKAQQSSGPFLSGSTSALVNYLVSGTGGNGTAGPASIQTDAVNNALKNYLAQCGQLAKQQAMAQSFTRIV
jgi:Ca2+-binding EF-hand superfamily protein